MTDFTSIRVVLRLLVHSQQESSALSVI